LGGALNIALALSSLALLLGVVVLLIRRWSMHGKNYQACFNQVFGSLTRPPKFEYGRSYGFPQFTVTFETRQDLSRAEGEGLTQHFSKLIEALCLDSDSSSNQFDVSRAIWFTSEEEIRDIREWAKREATKKR